MIPGANVNDSYYSELLARFGPSPQALGWTKGNQILRFRQLVRDLDLANARILDVGCGFGDFVSYLENQGVPGYYYQGIDAMPEFILEAKKRYVGPQVNFVQGDFLEHSFDQEFDFAFASGVFNLTNNDHYAYDRIYSSMARMLSLSKVAISLDFLSDKVDFFHSHNFNSSPERILGLAYSLSRKVVLRNDVFPFEFSLTIFRDDSFDSETSLFLYSGTTFDASGSGDEK